MQPVQMTCCFLHGAFTSHLALFKIFGCNIIPLNDMLDSQWLEIGRNFGGLLLHPYRPPAAVSVLSHTAFHPHKWWRVLPVNNPGNCGNRQLLIRSGVCLIAVRAELFYMLLRNQRWWSLRCCLLLSRKTTSSLPLTLQLNAALKKYDTDLNKEAPRK